ncbi:energy transducer TonB [Candidatus Omnitrophota bacterium]
MLQVTYLINNKIPVKIERIAPPKPVIKPAAAVKEMASIPQLKQKAVTALKPRSEQKTQILIPEDLPKEQEALYLDYYQSIRQKIRQFVIRNYPRYIDRGEVCLYFVLLPNGKLDQIRVLSERSCENTQLQQIAEKSVRQAAPFIAFPQQLDQPQLSFNVVISFEVEP